MALDPGEGPHRRAAAIGTGLVLLVVALVAAAAPSTWSGALRAHIPPTGDIVLQKGEEAITDWVEVAAGQQARWAWDAHAYIVFEVAARDVGLLAGDDTGGGQGCARADPPFAMRMWFGHTALGSQEEPAHVNYSIVVEAADSSTCPSVMAVHQNSGVSGGPLDESQPSLAGALGTALPMVAGNMAYLAMVAATFRPPRAVRREQREERMIEKEHEVQERERWVAEQVRAREGRRP
jgi:hypothetical protein